MSALALPDFRDGYPRPPRAAITLRPYQIEVVGAALEGLLAGDKRVLYTQATGTGKTVTRAERVRLLLDYHDYKVLVDAHRQEILTQTCRMLRDYCGLNE